MLSCSGERSSKDEVHPSVWNTGVRAKDTIPSQSTAGPYPADIQLGMNTSDHTALLFFLDVKPRQGKIVSDKSEVSLTWMLYVKPARDRHEQNVEAFRDIHGSIFFRSLRLIGRKEQLFVWYSDKFARDIGIPVLTPSNIRSNQQYACSNCGKIYEYPNPLKAHMRFRCPKSRAEILSSLLESPIPPSSKLGMKWLTMLPPDIDESADPFVPHSSSPATFSPRTEATVTRKKPKTFDRIPSISASTSILSFRDSELSSPDLLAVNKSKLSDKPTVLSAPRRTIESPKILTHSVENAASASMTTLNSPQPIQIFNHIHPPAIPIPVAHHGFKFFYPLYAMHESPSYCCGGIPSGQFGRSLLPNSYVSASGPHHKPSLRETLETSGRSTEVTDCAVPVSSPVCSMTKSCPYPMPTSKAGEPLDLLPRHLYLSKSKKGHLCIYCGKFYSRKYGLKIHLRTHTGYKPLKCKVCLRPFGDPSNLNKHIRLHAEGETPYRCEFCGKVLVRRRDLVRHIKSRHPNEAERAEEIENKKVAKTGIQVKSETIEALS